MAIEKGISKAPEGIDVELPEESPAGPRNRGC